MIEVRGLTKRYGGRVVVDDLTFTVAPGRVTGFLGPNGAGKSTTMRMILGLDAPASGSALVNGVPYARLTAPMREVGALLDPGALHPGRGARAHLAWLARAGGVGRARVEEVLDLVGLSEAAHRRVAEFSLGMRQRLGIAASLLGDPGVVMLDEPLNGLDPEGIVWLRSLLGGLAAQGRTVFVSSHLMNEMEATAGHVLVIGSGRLVADIGVAELTRRAAGAGVTVVAPRWAELLAALPPGSARADGRGGLTVTGLDAAAVGEAAARRGIALHELTTHRPRLEDAFMDLTRGGDGRRARAAAGSAADAGRPAAESTGGDR
ncbi:ABC transporter ATP-binding protein [Actinorugispora endophytica]|uniref:ABC-2 type transport system ATP-binding protein n=1 Tax=Actinorugispora endophytica TaxID=1605990 RepID=A0A4R6UKT2_9ACTN|nr:ATP-binding cassette domain-containing protein [Actinorugispora endophytica]TDQ45725.1 ABC-2 type transport system ATP-binding protein [Actinorugispora endophytica]